MPQTDYAPLWVGMDGLTQRGTDLMSALAKARDAGASALQPIMAAVDERRAATDLIARAELELLLSGALLDAAVDTTDPTVSAPPVRAAIGGDRGTGHIGFPSGSICRPTRPSGACAMRSRSTAISPPPTDGPRCPPVRSWRRECGMRGSSRCGPGWRRRASSTARMARPTSTTRRCGAPSSVFNRTMACKPMA